MPRCLKEVHRAKANIAVVGNRNRLLPNIGNMVDQLFNVAGAVQKRIIRMQMQMSKFSHCAALIFRAATRSSQERQTENP